MDAGNYQESSSSSSSHCKYQVFLSFRGTDTRKNFTNYLYKALDQSGIHTFRDDDEIRSGENIELELQQAIQQSKIAVIVFSKNYASSKWCLDELVKIMERWKSGSCIVLPVFYHVDPSHVRNQTESFAAAFAEHEKRLKEEMERVKGWRIALKNVAYLAGEVLGDRYEDEFVRSIVKKVSKVLAQETRTVPRLFIGRDALINNLNSWLLDGSHDAAIAFLYGIGGVGKTAIAESVYYQNFHKFEGSCFLSEVRESSKKSNIVVRLQKKLLSNILKKTAVEIYDVNEGSIKIENALRCRRSLIVLDDVDNRDQFNAFVRMPNRICQGGKIIITTRNKGLIAADDECVIFKVEPLNNRKSLELFSWHAFKQVCPIEDFVEESVRIVHHCNGLPLALCVIGCSLYGKRREIWESALQEMEVIPNCRIQMILRKSYDSLDDDYQKNLFLDIACFFNGMDEDYAVKILDGLGIGARFKIDNLIDKCLVEINNDKRLWMHRLIRNMGREIAGEESSKYQRIWRHKDAFTTLKETTDAENLRGLTLDMHDLMEENYTELVCSHSMVCPNHNFFQRFPIPTFLSRKWDSDFGQTSSFPELSMDAFRKMQNVKFLQLNHMKFNGSYEYFPKKLIWLCWHGFSLRSIPKHFCLETLAVLDLSRSRLVDGWQGKLFLPKLKILDLRHSHDLIITPDFSGLPCLEKLILKDCIHLVRIHESIRDLHCLMILNLRNCTSLMDLPEEISSLKSLKKLVLHGCTMFYGFNMESEHHQGRMLLHSDGMVASTSYIASLPLKLLFPSWFSARKISRFTLFSLPHSLTELNLRGTPIRFLPESIKDLRKLSNLYLDDCKMLQTLPKLPSNLFALDVSYCNSLRSLGNVIPLIAARNCDQLFHFQDWTMLELTHKADFHMFKIMEMVSVRRHPLLFQIALDDYNFQVFLDDEKEMLRFYEEEEGEWIIENEFVEDLSFKISSPAMHRICGFDFFTRLYTTSVPKAFKDVYLEIRNKTKGIVWVLYPFHFPLKLLAENFEFLWLSHWKFGDYNPKIDNGDDISVSVFTNDPGIEIKRVGVRMLHEEEGDDDNIHSNSEVITTHCSSDDVYATKSKIASHIFRNYDCIGRYNMYNDNNLNMYSYYFEMK